MSQTSFEAAAKYLSSSSALSSVSNTVKLELYALFKAITVSRRPETKRPSIFDIAGRAKWDAWDALGRDVQNTDVAALRVRYIAKARELGWSGDTNLSSVASEEEEKPIDWDTDDVPSVSGRGNNNVSTMANNDPQPTLDSLHGCVHANDIDSLRTLIQQPGSNVNVLDDFGFTALHLAADRGNEDMTKLLLQYGADPTITDPDGETAFSLAEVSHHTMIMALLRPLTLSGDLEG